MKEAKEKLRYSTLFWLFFTGSLAGFLMEGVWRIFTIGHWENHSAVVWGPFCIVYGFGAVAMYLVAFFSEKKRLWLQFLIYAAAGMAVEYLASYFQELFFGSRSWDYSDDFLNINGRVSAGMGGIWGLCGLAFVKLLYPLLKRIDESLHGGVFARVSCIVLSVFMAANLLVTSAAILRWKNRLEGQPPKYAVDRYLDRHYDNGKMSEIFNNMVFGEPEE